MPIITNKAQGPRIVWEKDRQGNPRQRVLQIGESAEINLANPDDHVLGAWREVGEIEISGPSSKPVPSGGQGGESKPDPDKLTDEELRALLKDKSVTADARWNRDKLVSETKKVLG